MNLESIVNEVETWTVEDRLRLIEQVWGSISSESQLVDLTDEQFKDLESRLETHRESPLTGSQWDEVKARLRSS
jgi:putative addiction module component (TIGR02574 family)